MPEEDVYRQFKEDPNCAIPPHPRRARSRLLRREPRTVRDVRAFAYARKTAEYVAWKTSLRTAVDDIKSEVREQHQQTRQEI